MNKEEPLHKTEEKLPIKKNEEKIEKEVKIETEEKKALVNIFKVEKEIEEEVPKAKHLGKKGKKVNRDKALEKIIEEDYKDQK